MLSPLHYNVRETETIAGPNQIEIIYYHESKIDQNTCLHTINCIKSEYGIGKLLNVQYSSIISVIVTTFSINQF